MLPGFISFSFIIMNSNGAGMNKEFSYTAGQEPITPQTSWGTRHYELQRIDTFVIYNNLQPLSYPILWKQDSKNKQHI